MKILRRLAFLLRRRAFERELVEEMRAHREAMGEPRSFGNTLRLREEARDAWGWLWLDDVLQDLRHGFRILGKQPAYAFAAIAVLALGIGLNLTLAQVVNAIAWKPLNVREPQSLVRFWRRSPHWTSSSVPYQLALHIERHTHVLQAVVTEQSSRLAWGEGNGQRAAFSFVSANFFQVMGGGPARGRVFDRSDETGPPVVVVSHQFWKTRLHGDPSVLGSTVILNGRKATLLGITAEGFHGPSDERTDGWLLMDEIDYFFPGSAERESWSRNNVDMYARLRAGVSPKAAEDGLRALIAELARAYPDRFKKDEWLQATLAADHFRGEGSRFEIRVVITLLGGLCLLVLLVACANVAGLGMAQATARLNEFRMRSALGAGRGRVLRQLLTEAAVLACGATVGGWLVGYSLASGLATLNEFDTPMELVPGVRLAGVALLYAWITMLSVGLVPAWRVTRRDGIATGLRDHGSTSGSVSGVQRVLLATQVMGTAILLVVTALTAAKLERLVSADFGFVMDGVAVVDAPLFRHGYSEGTGAEYWRRAKEAMATDPRVAEASVSSLAPLGRGLAETRFGDTPRIKATHLAVDPDFFRLMRIPIIRGRNFGPGDNPRNAVILGRRLAEEMYGTADVIGKAFPRTNPEATVVGVAADATLIKIQATDTSELYQPIDPGQLRYAVLLLRLQHGVSLEAPAAIMRRVDDRVLPEVRWMTSDYERRLAAPRVMWEISRGVGAYALLLSALGIFGLVAYTVSLRTREIGVRLALGANAGAIIWLVVRGLGIPIVAGAAAGLLVATAGLGGVLSGDPFYLDPNEPIAVVSASAVLVAAVVVAMFGPVRRALRIDPLAALRHD